MLSIKTIVITLSILVAVAIFLPIYGPAQRFIASADELPNLWFSQDIGNVYESGAASYANGTFTIENYGCDIYGSADEAHFVYQQLSGDVEVIARLESISLSDSWAKGGVMIRETLAPGSPHAFMSITKGNGSIFFWRTLPNGSTSDEFVGDSISLPHWVKIEREGNTFRGYKSSDGSNWVQVAEATVQMSQDAFVGMAVSGCDSQANVTEFDNVAVNGSGSQPPVNTAPVLSPIGNKEVEEGQQLQFVVSGSDADGDQLTYSDSNLPSGASFNGNTQVFSWSPSSSQSGVYPNITFTVSDGQASDSEAITITVNDVPDPPTGNSSFTDVRNATAGTPYTSNTITVLDIQGTIVVSVSGGTDTSLIKNGSDTGLTSINVGNGDRIAITSKSASTSGATNTVAIDIGGIPDSWSITTAAIDPLPNASGSMSGYSNLQFGVNESGAAGISIPVVAPPGTAGMQPDLAISYSNHGGNALLGAGFSLSGLSTILRCPATIAQDSGFSDGIDFDGNDRFCLDGERLKAVSGSYGAHGTEYRVEHETFSRVFSYGSAGDGPEKFLVQAKDGLTMEFGYTEDSRIQAQGKASVLFWAVNKILDTKGNYITVSYDEDTSNSEYRPTRIDYTGNANAGLAPYNSVRFAYEDRPDNVPSYIGGSRAKMTKRLAALKTYNRNNVFREYRLLYSTSMATNRSHLTSITECGSDGSCFAPTEFDWQSLTGYSPDFDGEGSGVWGGHNRGTANNFVGDFDGDGNADLMKKADDNLPGKWNIRLSNGGGFDFIGLWDGHQGVISNNYLGDYNGDGKTDIAAAAAGQGQWHVCLSTGSSFNCSFWENGHWGNPPNNIIGDFNGDGKTDMAGHSGADVWHVCLSTGSGFNCDHWNGGHAAGPLGTVVGDFNGDGKTDMAGYDGVGQQWHVTLSTGSGFGDNGSGYWAGHTGGVEQNVVGDFNGDGKTDLAGYDSVGKQWHVTISTGYGFDGEGSGYWVGHTGGPDNNLVGDFNGDGKTDMAGYDDVGQKWHVTLSTGIGFNGEGSNFWNGPKAGVGNNVAADFNGDGFTDIAGYVGPANQWEIKLVGGVYADLLTKVTNGHGGVTKIQYKPLTDSSVHTPDSDAGYPRFDLRAPVYVVSSYSTSDGVGGERVFNYHYYGAEMNLAGRGFRGFRQVEFTDQLTGIRTITDYEQDHRFVGNRVKRVQQFAPGGVLISDVTNTAALEDVGPRLFWSYVQTSVAKKYELDGSLVSVVTTTNDFDNLGNLLQTTVDFGDGRTETTTNQYDNDLANWILGRLRLAQVQRTAPNHPAITRTSAFEYDAQSGLLTKEITEPNHSALRQEKIYEHDVFGNIIRSVTSGSDIESRTYLTRYDPEGRFVLENENALGHVETSSYRMSRRETLTGPNDLTTAWAYDGFGRPASETRADGTQTRTLYLLCGPCPSEAKYFMRTDASGSTPAITYYDILDREVRKEGVGFDGRKIFIDTEYNPRGEVFRVSEPYFEGDSPVWTTLEYDAIGRPIRKTAPGNRTTTTSYRGLTTVVTNSLGQNNTTTVNASGWLVSSTDNLNGTVAYEHDSYGNVVRVMDTANNQTTMSYDARGNKTSMDDPDAGLMTYDYNALSEVVSQTDAKGQTVTTSYDLLGRLIQRQEIEGVTTWEYDTRPMGIGKTAKITAPDGYAETFTYDQFGRVSETTTEIVDEQFSVANIYDQYSRLDTVTYPTGFAAYNVYVNGYLAEVRRAGDDYRYWKLDARTARGQLKDATLGNGRVEGYNYDPNTGRVSMISVGGAQLLGFTFDAIGNLIERKDHIRSLSETFQYDGLNRLAQASVAGAQTITVSYDAIGNITQKSDVGTYTYGQNGAGPHAVTSISGVKANSYVYDANGNRINSNSGSIQYTSYNKPSRITEDDVDIEFMYGASRNRYKQVVKENGQVSSTKIYVGGIYEREITDALTKDVHYVMAGGEAIAVENHRTDGADDVLYLHRDHLGSVQTITDHNNQVVEVLSFDPWGNRRNFADWSAASSGVDSQVDRGFTGHEHLDAVSLIHMNGRVYDPVIGRFLSPDPFVQVPEFSQSLNRYSYVMNNPLSLVDPSGFFIKNIFKFIEKHKKVIASAVIGFATAGVGIWAASAVIGQSITLGSAFGAVLTGNLTTAGAITAGAGYGFGSAFSGTLLHGGSITAGLQAGLKAGVISGITAGVTHGVVKGFKEWRNGQLGGLYDIDATGNIRLTKVLRDRIQVNGILNDVEGAAQLGAFQNAGRPFTLVHNQTHGFIADMTESFLGKAIGPSNASKQLADILQNAGSQVSELTGHSQGGILVTNALEVLAERGAKLPNLTVNFYGAAVNELSSRAAVAGVGAKFGAFGMHFADLVPNVIGFNGNPIRMAASLLASPTLFMGPSISPHSIYP